MNPKILPTCMVILSLAASLIYAINKDFRHGIYWLATAIIVSAVTY